MTPEEIQKAAQQAFIDHTPSEGTTQQVVFEGENARKIAIAAKQYVQKKIQNSNPMLKETKIEVRNDEKVITDTYYTYALELAKRDLIYIRSLLGVVQKADDNLKSKPPKKKRPRIAHDDDPTEEIIRSTGRW